MPVRPTVGRSGSLADPRVVLVLRGPVTGRHASDQAGVVPDGAGGADQVGPQVGADERLGPLTTVAGANSTFSATNAGRSTRRSFVIQVESPGSLTRTIGCQMNGR